jgi:hypothetical protein
MSAIQTPTLTYEQLMEMFRQANEQANERFEKAEQQREKDREERDAERAKDREARRKADAKYEQLRRELNRQMKETHRKISALGSRVGEIVENMIGGRIVNKFRALGYEVRHYTRNHYFESRDLGIRGEIDLVLYNGDVNILIEVKTTLGRSDVRRHLKRMAEYRRFVDVVRTMWPPSTRFIGAIAGAVVKEGVPELAHENGVYTIVQSGEAVEILPVPENFQARKW